METEWISTEQAMEILGIGRMPANRLAQVGAVRARKAEKPAVNGHCPWEFDRASVESRAERLKNECSDPAWMPIAEAMFLLNMTRHGIKRRVKMGLLDSRQYGPPEKLALYVNRKQVEEYHSQKPVYRARAEDEAINVERDFVIWFAGFFDGEGTVGIKRPYRRGGTHWTVAICVPNTCFAPLEDIARHLGGAVGCRRPQTDTRKETRAWRASASEAVRILRLSEPFLRVKRQQALLAISFYEHVDKHRYGRWSPMPESELLWREEQKQRMHQLNRRGPLPTQDDE